VSDDAQDPFLHDPQAFERMIETMRHTYPPNFLFRLEDDAAWEILDRIKPGVIPDDVRAFLAGQVAGRLMREGRAWQPIETAPRDRDVLLWVPASAMLADLIAGHMEVGRAWGDGRATHWMPLPEPPKASEPRAVAE
jgi:hypothetical protein